jgi:hypothetical protein
LQFSAQTLILIRLAGFEVIIEPGFNGRANRQPVVVSIPKLQLLVPKIESELEHNTYLFIEARQSGLQVFSEDHM